MIAAAALDPGTSSLLRGRGALPYEAASYEPARFEGATRNSQRHRAHDDLVAAVRLIHLPLAWTRITRVAL